jgi:hypothetical protein
MRAITATNAKALKTAAAVAVPWNVDNGMTVTEASILDKTMLAVSRAAVVIPVVAKITRRILSASFGAIVQKPESGILSNGQCSSSEKIASIRQTRVVLSDVLLSLNSGR